MSDALDEFEIRREHTFRSRKFGFAAVSFLVANTYFITDMLSDEYFVSLMFVILSMYTIGSVGDKIAARPGK